MWIVYNIIDEENQKMQAFKGANTFSSDDGSLFSFAKMVE
jgi:hypothetical protein